MDSCYISSVHNLFTIGGGLFQYKAIGGIYYCCRL